MGFLFEFDEANNICRCSWEGQITDDIMWQTYAAAGKLLASWPPYRGISDLSRVGSFDVSNETIKRLAKMPPVVRPEMVHVIIAPKDHLYGLSRMFEMLSEQNNTNLHVVHTMQEAKALLGVASPQFSPINVA